MKQTCDCCNEERDDNQFVRNARAKRRTSILLGNSTGSNVCIFCVRYADSSAHNSRGRLLNTIKSFRRDIETGTIPDGFENLEASSRLVNKRCADESKRLLAELRSLHEFHQRATTELNALREERLRLMMRQYKHRRSIANYHISKFEIREMVFYRSGNRCIICGTKNKLTVDHIIPVVHGGTDDLDNLQALCKSCNSRKGASQ
jgi:hypothetical protein